MLIFFLVLLGAAHFLTRSPVSSPTQSTITYRGKSLEAWFYGDRTNFYSEQTMKATQDAIGVLGTNAFPFLLCNLKERRGNGILYCGLYGAIPVRLQARLPFPLSGDDIRAITLDHLRKMRGLSGEQVQALANCVPDLENPRVRMKAFNLIKFEHQTDPAFLKLCRKLLSDPHPGIQLAAAISLGQSAIMGDPGEPRLFPILLTALEHKKWRESNLEVEWYRYRQQPPGGSGGIPVFLRSPFVQRPEVTLQEDLISALERLETHLSQEQKDRLSNAKKLKNL